MTRHRSWDWTAPTDGWDKIPAPMRPRGDDLIFREEAIAEWPARNGPPRVLIMGVTPEYAMLPWPQGSHVVALDRSRPMIDSVWPGPPESVVCGDWTEIPLGQASRDFALCDGGLSMLTYPDGLARAAAELARIVAPGGGAIFRLYVPPAESVTARQVVEDVVAGRVATSMEFSILLWGALYDPANASYKVGQSLTTLETFGHDPREFFARAGWNPDEIDNLEKLRQSGMWLYFPTVDQVRDALSASFTLEKVLIPSYRLGERFPTVIFRRD